MNPPVEVAVAAANTLGEGVLWCDREQAVYWTDIPAARLWRHHPGDGTTRSWPMPERLASMALCEADGWLLLALASRLAFFHPGRNELRELHRIDTVAETRANDGACDRQGRFVFGMLHEPAQGAKQAIAPFHRLNADLSLQRLSLPPVAIANSIAFSPDGRTLYFCDSLQKVIQQCDYGDDLGPPRVFADLRAEAGEPDGSAVDADGALWNARWGDARLVRYLPDGTPQQSIALPALQPTRPAFGGPDGRTLFVTSAHEGLPAPVRAGDPQAGHLFAVHTATGGLAEPRFAGNPDALPPR
ncbi:SMP-30/gluconolactonase/LRE family protein [Stenotrophomonas sp. 24(2023)]|uniref:SMP-30/gluconolactonase/LRE family protein n=1 Tax=Stenotrophomonas sp. 24(2023) TaxID=3068324 RepID=UPI0027E0EE86|nr:SMP-30/gluconolactonase/LRE family protein [Stenotrophomonas sp. 24(2023)]WMJ68229.1 SMP-30/gluconolactonase/LRE family protein [Stenotrophomonas sp. 24(2023)]